MHFVVAPRSQVHAFPFQLAHFNGQKDPMAVGAGRNASTARGARLLFQWQFPLRNVNVARLSLGNAPWHPASPSTSFSLSLFLSLSLSFVLSVFSPFLAFSSFWLWHLLLTPCFPPTPAPHLLLTAPTSSSQPSVASRNHHLTDSITFNLNRGMQPKSPSMTPSPTFFGEALNASLQVIRHLWPPEPVTRSLLARYRHHDTSWHPAAVAHHGRPSPRQLSFRVIHSSSLKFTQVEPLSRWAGRERLRRPKNRIKPARWNFNWQLNPIGSRKCESGAQSLPWLETPIDKGRNDRSHLAVQTVTAGRIGSPAACCHLATKF